MKRYCVIVMLLLSFLSLQGQKVVVCHSGGMVQEQFRPDSTVNGIFVLSDSRSAVDFHAGISQKPLQDGVSPYNPSGYSFAAFVNKDRSQYLLAFKYDGDAVNSYSAFEIGRVTADFLAYVSEYHIMIPYFTF